MRQSSTAINLFRAAVVILLVVLLVAEVLIYFPPAQVGITSSISVIHVANETFSGALSIKSSYSTAFNATWTVSSGNAAEATIYFYYDAAYPSSWSLPVWSYGLRQHIASILGARGLFPRIVVLNATQLSSFLQSPSQPGSLLIMPTGVLPATIFTKTTNELAPWIRAGGLLVWFGDTIGYYSGQPNTPLNYSSPANPAEAGVAQFVNVSIFGSNYALYTNSSVTSAAYGFTYSYSLGHDGIDLQMLQDEGGEVLGELAGNYTNAARIPLGKGAIDYFAVPLTHDVTQMSVAIANMLESGVLTGPFAPLGVTSIGVPAGREIGRTLNITAPFLPWANATSEICLLVYQTGYLAIYDMESCISLFNGVGATFVPTQFASIDLEPRLASNSDRFRRC